MVLCCLGDKHMKKILHIFHTGTNRLFGSIFVLLSNSLVPSWLSPQSLWVTCHFIAQSSKQVEAGEGALHSLLGPSLLFSFTESHWACQVGTECSWHLRVFLIAPSKYNILHVALGEFNRDRYWLHLAASTILVLFCFVSMPGPESSYLLAQEPWHWPKS